MKFYFNNRLFPYRRGSVKLSVFAACFIAVAAVMGQVEVMRVKGLRLPLEYYPDGSHKVVLRAESAKVSPDGNDIDGGNLRYEMLAENQTTNIVITADECRYDRKAGLAKSGGRVDIRKEGVKVTGKGFILDSNKQMVSILEDVRVEIESTGLGGRKDVQ